MNHPLNSTAAQRPGGMEPLLVAALMVTSGAPALAITGGSTDPSSPANNAVVQLSTEDDGPLCSGVLIAPTIVLTAGHCLQAAILNGSTGAWSSKNPIWRPYNLPVEIVNPDWISGLKGDSRMLDNIIIGPFNYREQATATATDCQRLCEAEGQCRGWTFFKVAPRCYLKKTPKLRAFFGNVTGAPVYSAVSSTYSVAGFADIAVMRLDAPVPSSVAVPARVLTDLPGSVADIGAFLAGLPMRAVGFSSAQPTRQQASMSLFQYPYNGWPEMTLVSNAGGAITEGGDSGSPLFWLSPNGPVVIGINQGFGGASRYTLTAANKARPGELLTFPYGPGALDPTQGAAIGEWLNNILYADFVSRFKTIPLYNWYNESRGDNFLSSAPVWASQPLGGVKASTTGHLNPLRWQGGYRMYRHEGYVFSPKEARPAGTVPLFSWYHPGSEDNFATTDPRWSTDPSRLVFSGDTIVGGPVQNGYTMYRLEGYVYDPHAPQPAGTRPLYSWWNSTRGDNFASTDSGWAIPPSDVRWDGEHLSNVRTQSGYGLYRLEGYVLESPPRR